MIDNLTSMIVELRDRYFDFHPRNKGEPEAWYPNAIARAHNRQVIKQRKAAANKAEIAERTKAPKSVQAKEKVVQGATEDTQIDEP